MRRARSRGGAFRKREYFRSSLGLLPPFCPRRVPRRVWGCRGTRRGSTFPGGFPPGPRLLFRDRSSMSMSRTLVLRRAQKTRAHRPTICDRFSPSRPKSAAACRNAKKQSGGNNDNQRRRHVAHIAARGVSGRALETNSATRRRVSPLQTTSASPGAFSSSGAAGAHEAARPAPRAVDVDWLIRNTKRALTRRDGRRPRQHRLSEGSARGDHRDAGH